MAKRRFNYIRRKPASGTRRAVFSGFGSLILLLLCLLLSVREKGQGPLLLGALGLSSLLAAVFSIFCAFYGLQERDRNRTGVRIAGACSTLIALLWAVLIFVGLRLSR